MMAETTATGAVGGGSTSPGNPFESYEVFNAFVLDDYLDVLIAETGYGDLPAEVPV